MERDQRVHAVGEGTAGERNGETAYRRAGGGTKRRNGRIGVPACRRTAGGVGGGGNGCHPFPDHDAPATRGAGRGTNRETGVWAGRGGNEPANGGYRVPGVPAKGGE